MKTSSIMKTKILIALASLCMICSCSNKPSIGDIDQTVREQISEESEGRIELVSIEKTNSTDREMMGQEIHTIEYKAKIKFLKDCYMYVNKSGFGPFIQSFKTYTEQPEFIPSLQMQGVSCDIGVEIDYAGSSSFSNTENGWIQNK